MFTCYHSTLWPFLADQKECGSGWWVKNMALKKSCGWAWFYPLPGGPGASGLLTLQSQLLHLLNGNDPSLVGRSRWDQIVNVLCKELCICGVGRPPVLVCLGPFRTVVLLKSVMGPHFIHRSVLVWVISHYHPGHCNYWQMEIWRD